MSKHITFSSFSTRPLLKNELQLTSTKLNQLSNFTESRQIHKLAHPQCMTKLNTNNNNSEKILICQNCQVVDACVQCIGCGEIVYCEGCFGRLHDVGKFRAHQIKRIVAITHDNNRINQASIQVSRHLASLSPNSTIRTRNSRKENKLTDQQLKQLLSNQITSFNIKYQDLASNSCQIVQKIKSKWEKFEQLVHDQFEKIKQILDKVQKNLVSKIRSQKQFQTHVSSQTIVMEEIKFDIIQYQRGDRKINEGQLLAKIRNFNQFILPNNQINKIFKKKCEEEQKANRAVKLGFIDMKKIISNFSVQNIFEPEGGFTLLDSKYSMSTELDYTTLKKNVRNQKYYEPKRQATKILAKPVKKGQLDESFCSLILEPSQKNNLVKGKSEIFENYDVNKSVLLPKTIKRRNTDYQFNQITQ